jgi:hypothetical protein
MAVEATLEHRGRFEFGQMAAIQEQTVRVARNFAAGREPRDWHALQRDKSQRALSAMGKESLPVPDGDETHGAVPLLQGRDLAKHLEFTCTFPGGIAWRPTRGPHHCDLIAICLGPGVWVKACRGQPASHPREGRG